MRVQMHILILLTALTAACSQSKPAAYQSQKQDEHMLEGNWELNFLAVEGGVFDELYKNKKPTIRFDPGQGKFGGTTSCNSYSGALKTDGSKIDFTGPIAMTKMACQGQGENVFIEKLKQADHFYVSDANTLDLLSGEKTIMRFIKQ